MKLHHHGDNPDVSHEINVTPFIDVMLVLLIIFMVAAPLATVNVPIDLPVSTAAAQPRADDPIVLSVGKNLALSIGNDPVDRATVGSRLLARARGDRTARIFLRADRAVSYGDVMAVMDLMRDAGFLKVALVGAEPGERR